MGAASGFVTLSIDPCPSPTPTPSPPSTVNNDQCFQIVAAPGTTSFDAQDIARIKLPKKATRNVIYPVLNIFLDYQLENSTGASVPNDRQRIRETLVRAGNTGLTRRQFIESF